MKGWKFALPLALFVLLAVLLARGLNLNPHEVPSPLIGKPAPEFALPRLDDAQQRVGRAQMLGQVWVLNVWASWCGPCQDEHPVIQELARRTPVAIVGLNYKDQRTQATQWLAKLGNPYKMTLVDADGRTGMDWGVYGVPETFIIDRQGVIRMKHVGPVTLEVLNKKIEPLLKELQS